MSVRDARKPGIALAGVAAIALVVAGVAFLGPDRHRAGAITKPALTDRAPRWNDGYNHFIVTVPQPLGATAAEVVRSRLARHRSALRGKPSATASAAPRGPLHAWLTVATKAATGKGGATQRGLGGPVDSDAALGGRAWQALPPNPSHPVVWRPGQPISLLEKRLADFPKGTTLERDADGNIRAVLPSGWYWSAALGKALPTGEPAGKTAHEPRAARSGRPGAHKSTGDFQTGDLPPGWLPGSRAVVASLLRLPGVHSASPVWKTKYQVATTLTAAELRQVPGISKVASNNLFAFAAASLPATNDPDLSDEYYMANNGQSVLGQTGTSGASANFSYAWARTRGSGVVIADIDTGVDVNNPDLGAQILPQSEDFAVSPPTSDVEADGTQSGFYHATTVDGVMAAVAGNAWGGGGAAPEAKVLALKCSDSGSLADSCIYSAGEYAISEKEHAGINVKVINMSFGEQASSDPTLASLVSDAQAAGILVAASAGNWGANNDSSAVLPASWAGGTYGGAGPYGNVISVGATDNQDSLASYSDYGATTVDLMAPGTNMFTDYPTYTGYDNAYVSGTSYSAPMVAAAAALLWSVSPTLTYGQVKSDIDSSVQTVGGLSGKCVTGGRLNVQAALALVSEPVQFTFTSFDQVQPNTVANVSLSASGSLLSSSYGSTPLGYHLELAYSYSGNMYNVVGQTVGWSMGGSGTTDVSTGSDGSVFITPSGITGSNYGTSPLNITIPSPGLTSGTYALVAYAATTADPTAAIGNPQAVFFNAGTPSPVPPPNTTTTSPTTPTTTSSSSSSSTSTTSAGGTTSTTLPTTTVITGPFPTIGTGPSTSLPATTTTTTSGATTTTSAGTTTTSGATTTTSGATTTTTSATTTTAATTTTTAATTTSSPTTTSATTSTTAATTTTTAGATTTTTGLTTTTGPTTTTTAAFSVDSVDPNQLPQTGGNVTIFGNNLPANPVVTVGATYEAVGSASSTEIDISVGAMTPGNYTVTVYNATETQSAALLDGLTVGSPTTTTTAGATTTTSGSGTTTTVTTAPTTTTAATTTTTSATTTTATTVAGTTTTTMATTTTTSQATTTTGPGGTIVYNGMTLSPVSSGQALSSVPVGEWPAFTASQVNQDNGAVSGTAVDGVDV